jgi:spore germination protein YaaH
MISEKNADKLVKAILKRVKMSKFDGVNLDCTQFWFSEDMYPLYVTFQQKLFAELNKLKKKLIITLFPYSESMQNIINRPRFDYLSRYSDFIMVMSYDYIQYFQKEDVTATDLKNSPEKWILDTVDYYIDRKKKNSDELLAKLLAGYSFHGFIMDLTETRKLKGNILEGEKLQSISKAESSSDNYLSWNDVDKEYSTNISNEESSFRAVVPSIKSLKERINLVEKNGLAGISIWEAGQGYDIWMEAI